MRRRILQPFGEGKKCSELDAALGVKPGTAHSVITQAWKQRKEVSKAPTTKSPPKRIPPELVRQIRAAKGTMTLKAAHKKFGVSESAINRIWRGETYREVQ